MKIGITYDLKEEYLAKGYAQEDCAEFDSPETIDAIEAFLVSRGCETKRIGNIKALTAALAAGQTYDLVFNIAEGLYGRAREAQVPALLDAYRIPYVFSDPLVLALTLDKALTKRVAQGEHIPTAEFFVCPRHMNFPHMPGAFPLFVKPNADGTGKGITVRSLVKNEAELRRAVAEIHSQYDQDALVERYLAGREFTVGITGTGEKASIIAVMEILLGASADACGYTYDNKQFYEDRVSYRIVEDEEARKAGEVALAAWRALGCRDGGRVDVRSGDTQDPHFLEVNPLAGLHPVLGDLVILSRLKGLSYHDLLGRILDSALADDTRFPYNPKPTLSAYA